MAGIKRFRYSFEPTGASVLDRSTVPRRVSTGRTYIVKTWETQLSSGTVGSSGRRRRARRSTGSTSPSFQKSVLTAPVGELADKFLRLSNEWKRDTGHLSLISQIAAHPSYHDIIAMGESAIPLILRDLETEPNHWFSALSAIADAEGRRFLHTKEGMSGRFLRLGSNGGRVRSTLNEHAIQIPMAPPTG